MSCLDAQTALAAAERPDILLIMPDQMRGDSLSELGHPVVRTPQLDALAKGGALFRRAYSTVASCIPARYALLTGLCPQTSGVGFAAKPIATPTLPGSLAQAGYATVLVGRLFLTASFYAPHPPLFPPKRIFDDVAKRSLPGPARGDWVEWAALKTDGDKGGHRVLLEGEARRAAQAGYYGLIEHLDEQVVGQAPRRLAGGAGALARALGQPSRRPARGLFQRRQAGSRLCVSAAECVCALNGRRGLW